MSSSPAVCISSVISPALETLICYHVFPPYNHPLCSSLTALHIHEMVFLIEEIWGFLKTYPCLRVLEIPSGIEDPDIFGPTETTIVSSHIEHALQTLIIGGIPKDDVDFLFRKIEFTDLRVIRLKLVVAEERIGEDSTLFGIPKALKSFVRGSTLLRVKEEGVFSCFIFDACAPRACEITLNIDRNDRAFSRIWDRILPQVVVLWPIATLTRLDIRIPLLQRSDVWSLMLSRYCTNVVQLGLHTGSVGHFLDAVCDNVGLLPRLQELDMSNSWIMGPKLVDCLEFRAASDSKLRKVRLPDRFAWNVRRVELASLAEEVIIQHDPSFRERFLADHDVLIKNVFHVEQ
ncbi:hypothetical protein SISSUDRAFT_1093686 [Sistotremastrum suecicum HHB10207 ss-3]|uniref:F-box domain-containing protein n=1 Tax=Sistotremastrum suecicum HHB10207 ss-3 TaxID=1314776 RepID=A0A165XP27_9AGAM|nr:hypothetical protein SISSUDRAFT_1093686 [Sistotremastrum suecicum HHB10207 ss-3]